MAGLILAAGAGRRMAAGPKALLRYRNEYFIDRLGRTLQEAGCSPVSVVLGCEADEVQRTAHLADMRVVVNPQWASGMASSFRVGIAASILGEADILVSVVDQPDVSKEIIARLRGDHGPGRITVPLYAGNPGHPVLLDAALARKAAATAAGDSGARAFMLRHPSVVDYVDCSDLGSGLDVDTPEDLRGLKDLLP
ncbi:hypothetical protein AC20117_22930 (plasmid) [Arthrobacter crystallopoietes]|nr:hypothetical protein AC20117_22930 [Arthrobacter crystallopoietes]